VSIFTANLVAGALLVSLIGATVAMSVRHLTAQNWTPNWEDIWYYIFSGTISVCLILLGQDTPTIIAATTGVNTPLALLKTGIDKYSDKKAGVELNKASIEAIKAELNKRKEVAEGG